MLSDNLKIQDSSFRFLSETARWKTIISSFLRLHFPFWSLMTANMPKLFPWFEWTRFLERELLQNVYWQSVELTYANANQNRSIWCDSIVNFADAAILKNQQFRIAQSAAMADLPDRVDPYTTGPHSGSFESPDRYTAVGSNWPECPVR